MRSEKNSQQKNERKGERKTTVERCKNTNKQKEREKAHLLFCIRRRREGDVLKTVIETEKAKYTNYRMYW